ncbi:MAG: hypothetical protein OXE74_09540 [Cyanobacteria bacterium MAG CAR2_bin_4]|nr:hypothetical protein [Cyanobacteria bacterium MAG CAR2_bin_4]
MTFPDGHSQGGGAVLIRKGGISPRPKEKVAHLHRTGCRGKMEGGLTLGRRGVGIGARFHEHLNHLCMAPADRLV